MRITLDLDVEQLDRAELPAVLGDLVELQARVLLRLAEVPAVATEDTNVSVEEAARRLGVSVRFCYRRAKELPAVRMGRRLCFSSRGLDEFIRKRRGR